AGHAPGDVDEGLGVRKAVTEQRHELGPAGERPRAVAERGGGFVGARRPQELHGALFRVPRPRGARAASPRASLRSRGGNHVSPTSPLLSESPRRARRPRGARAAAPRASLRSQRGLVGGKPPGFPRPFPPRGNAATSCGYSLSPLLGGLAERA